MTLRELMGNGAPDVEISGPRLLEPERHAGDALLLRARVPGRRPRLRAGRRRARRGRARLRAPARPRRARGGRRRRARRDGARGGALLRRPDGRAATWSASPARTARRRPPSWCATCSRPAGSQTGLLGTVKRVVGGVRGGGRAHHAGGDRPAGDLPRACSTAATAPARWRSPRTRSSSAASAGIHFACRVFTNLTQDHLDFHETMEAYFAAKRRLFERAGARAVVNVDDEYGRRLARRDADVRHLRASTATPTTAPATSSST